MSIVAMAWARRQKTGSPSAKAVLVTVADYADENGRAWPSQKRIAEDTELSVRTVRDALALLEEGGFLSREPYIREDNSRGSDRITLAIPGAAAISAGGGERIAGGGERSAAGVGKRLPGGGETVSPLTTFEPPPEPSEEPKETRAPRASSAKTEAEFAEWYSGYPHKVGRADARKAFDRARRTASLAELIAGRDRYIRAKPADRPWCNPSTWLNQERWADEPSADAPATRPPSRGDPPLNRPPSFGDLARQAEDRIHASQCPDHDAPYLDRRFAGAAGQADARAGRTAQPSPRADWREGALDLEPIRPDARSAQRA